MMRLAVYAAFGVFLLALVVAWAGGKRRRGGPGGRPGEAMVQDPECSTYLPRTRALIRRVEGVEHAFCSRACADAFERKVVSGRRTEGTGP